MRDPLCLTQTVHHPVLQVLHGQLAELLSVNTGIFPKKHAKRQSTIQIAQRPGQRRPLQTRQTHGERQRLTLQKTTHGRRLVNGQCEHLNAFGSMFTEKGIDHGQLLHAGRAPRGPEIHQQRTPTETGHVQHPAFGSIQAHLPEILHRLRLRGVRLQTPPGHTGPRCGRSQAGTEQPMPAKKRGRR